MNEEVREMVQRNKEIRAELKMFYRLKKRELDKDESFKRRSRDYKKLVKQRINLEMKYELNPKAVVTNARTLKLAERVQDMIDAMDKSYKYGLAGIEDSIEE